MARRGVPCACLVVPKLHAACSDSCAWRRQLPLRRQACLAGAPPPPPPFATVPPLSPPPAHEAAHCWHRRSRPATCLCQRPAAAAPASAASIPLPPSSRPPSAPPPPTWVVVVLLVLPSLVLVVIRRLILVLPVLGLGGAGGAHTQGAGRIGGGRAPSSCCHIAPGPPPTPMRARAYLCVRPYRYMRAFVSLLSAGMCTWCPCRCRSGALLANCRTSFGLSGLSVSPSPSYRSSATSSSSTW